MLISLYPRVLLARRVSEYIGVDRDDLLAFFFGYADHVLRGSLTINEALEKISLVNSSRYRFVDALSDFELDLYLNENVKHPDYATIDEKSDFTEESAASLSTLAKEAWERLQDADYIEGLFCFTLLISIFLSGYKERVIDTVDFESVLPAYGMLARAIIGRKLGDDYARKKST
ncbi:MAG: hypothetical protein WC965_02120 [Thiohalomonadaceae bacterium]